MVPIVNPTKYSVVKRNMRYLKMKSRVQRNSEQHNPEVQAEKMNHRTDHQIHENKSERKQLHEHQRSYVVSRLPGNAGACHGRIL